MEKKKQEYKSIDDYIHSFPEPIQKKLIELREVIREQAPQAQEKISYRMPTFFLNGNLVHFATHSKHGRVSNQLKYQCKKLQQEIE